MDTLPQTELVGWESKEQGQTYRIDIPESLTAAEAAVLTTILRQHCRRRTDIDQVVLDFSQTTFMDSMGLSALVVGYKLANAAGLGFTLTNLSSQVMLVLSMTGLNQVFDIDHMDCAA